MPKTKSWYKRWMVVLDETGKFVELSGWPWTELQNDDGTLLQAPGLNNPYEGLAEVITTDHAEAKKFFGEQMLKLAADAKAFRAERDDAIKAKVAAEDERDAVKNEVKAALAAAHNNIR